MDFFYTRHSLRRKGAARGGRSMGEWKKTQRHPQRATVCRILRESCIEEDVGSEPAPRSSTSTSFLQLFSEFFFFFRENNYFSITFHGLIFNKKNNNYINN